jgi:hypothetical protein
MTRSTILHTKKIMQTITSKSTLVTALGAVTLASLLAACGGGSSDAPASVLPTSNLQGIWTAGTLGTETASMVVLSSGASWLLVNHAPVQLITSVLKGNTTGYDGTGIEYTSGSTPAPAAVSYAAAVVPKKTLTGTVTQTGQSRALSFSYDPRYETAALQTEVVGTWTGTKNAGSVAVTWKIVDSGALTGSSTSGCSYGGNVLVHGAGAVPVGVFDLTLVETCSERGVDVVKNFGGIVVLNAAKTGATFAFSTAAGTEGDFLSTSKQQAAQ